MELGQLKLDVRAKHDEVVRIRHLYEDNLILVKETKLENEALRNKLEVLKSEYYKLESTARQGNADTKAELAVTKERLANYEMIEKELDQCIMHVAGNDKVVGEGAYDVGNALIESITQAPTTAKRRI
jgi:progesterone-induced-blocking factor 1